jgi:signal transduction histidine kinase
MHNRRWWDAAILAASLMVVVALAIGPSDAVWGEIVLTGIALLVFDLSYLLVARPALSAPRPWHLRAFVVCTSAALAAGCASEPFFAILLAVAYPITWVLAMTRRRAIVGSIVVAFGGFVGLALFGGILEGGDAVAPALTTAVATAGLGLAFAIAFGLWISSVVEYGEERARLLAELTAAQAEIEALSRDRGAAVERERIARDVHDTLAQTLAGLAILSERAGSQLSDGREDAAADTIATVERLSRDALDEARALVSRTAAVPSDAALGDAVERLVDRFRVEAGLTIDLDLRLDSAGVLSRDAQLVLLRCLQESLANVRKHAAATRVRVLVAAGPDGRAELSVADDGGGFDVNRRPRGFGLDGMAERVALAGGELDVRSSPGGGTTLVVRLPATAGAREVTR